MDGEDIVDHHHADKLKDYGPNIPLIDCINYHLTLVRDVGNEIDGVIDRQWAYVKNGELPNKFDDGSVIPQRFIKELQLSVKNGIINFSVLS